MQFANVTLDRGGRGVFDGLSLELREARIGIIGDNGSGKSSLLRLINGLLLPDTGSVLTCGLDTKEHRRELPGMAGFLFQNPEHQILFPTVAEEIGFGLREAGMEAGEVANRVRSILADHDIGDWEHMPVQQLSDGQKQRLCALAVLAMEPQILLLDEPFASLDLRNRRALSSEILAAPQQVIMASHDLDLMQKFERVIWLERGKIAADGLPQDIIHRYSRACLGEAEAVRVT